VQNMMKLIIQPYLQIILIS